MLVNLRLGRLDGRRRSGVRSTIGLDKLDVRRPFVVLSSVRIWSTSQGGRASSPCYALKCSVFFKLLREGVLPAVFLIVLPTWIRHTTFPHGAPILQRGLPCFAYHLYCIEVMSILDHVSLHNACLCSNRREDLLPLSFLRSYEWRRG